MGLFDFFKKSRKDEEEPPKEKYWVLSTNDSEIIDPTWEEVKAAIENATLDQSIFASLGYFHSGLEIEVVQAVGDENGYRFEALPPEGKIYVNDGISYEETLRLFREFFKYQSVTGFRSWPVEKW